MQVLQDRRRADVDTEFSCRCGKCRQIAPFVEELQVISTLAACVTCPHMLQLTC